MKIEKALAAFGITEQDWAECEEIVRIEEELAEQAQDDDDDTQVYAKPWVGLTDDEIYRIAFELEGEHWTKIARAIEAKLKRRNT